MIVKPREMHIKWNEEGRIYPGWHRDKNWVGTKEEYVVINFIVSLSNSLEIIEYDTNDATVIERIKRWIKAIKISNDDLKYIKKYITPDKDQ